MRFRTPLPRILAALFGLTLFASACSTGGGEDAVDDVVTDDTQDDESTTDDDTGDDADEGDEADDVDEGSDADTGSDEDEDEDDEPVDVPHTASFRGVSEDTIQLGVAFWDTSAFGFGFFGDVDSVWTVLTDAINTRGGVNGRTLEYTVAGFNPADNEGMLGACIALTEDAEVFAVLGGMRGDANFCVFEQHETIHLGSQVGAAGEALERARAPIAGVFPDGTAQAGAFITQLDAIGWFDGTTAVGLHYDGNDSIDRLGAAVEAALADIGVDIELTLNVDDLGLDEDTLEAQADIMREQARDAELERIIILGAAATGLLTYGELDIALAAVDSSNFTTAVSGGIDPADIDGTISSAVRLNLPTDQIDAKSQQCLDDVAAAIPEARVERPGPGVVNNADDPNYWAYTILACRDLDLFVQAATAAGVELTNDSFLVGLDSLTDTSLPEIPFASFGPGKYNGNDTLRLVEFDADADADGEVVGLTDPVDLTP